MALASLAYKPGHNPYGFYETKSGSYIYSGEPHLYFEWEFRTLMRISAGTEDNLPSIANKIIEGLRGEALAIAMSRGSDNHKTAADLQALVNDIFSSVFPTVKLEAQNLYQAGQKPGVLSRQVGEPMLSYVTRRKRWHTLLLQLDKDLKMPESMSGNLLLQQSNLSQDQKLMIMSAIKDDLTFDSVSKELQRQHNPTMSKLMHIPSSSSSPSLVLSWSPTLTVTFTA